MALLRRSALMILGLTTAIPHSPAQRRCPGNFASVPMQLVERTQIIVPAQVNGSRPQDFIVDTGSQITVIDSSLAAALNIQAEGMIGVVGPAARRTSSFARLSLMKVGTHSVDHPWVVIEDLKALRYSGSRVHGILGANFLAHFDLLVDYDHKMLCLGEVETIRDLGGEKIPFADVHHQSDEAVLGESAAISVADQSGRALLLLLDSGSDAAVLYNRPQAACCMQAAAVVTEHESDGATLAFTTLPLLDLKLGAMVLRNVSFITPLKTGGPAVGVDGLLPTSLFRRILISYSDRYIVLNPFVRREQTPRDADNPSTPQTLGR